MDHGLSHRALAETFECGRTPVAQIVKNWVHYGNVQC